MTSIWSCQISPCAIKYLNSLIFGNVSVRKFQVGIPKFLFIGGREVLIKFLLQTIPSYAMSCFKITASLCQRIEQVCASF